MSFGLGGYRLVDLWDAFYIVKFVFFIPGSLSLGFLFFLQRVRVLISASVEVSGDRQTTSLATRSPICGQLVVWESSFITCQRMLC